MFAVVDAFGLIERRLKLHTLQEVGIVAKLLWCPSCFCHSSKARKHEIFQDGGCLDPLSPEVGLHAKVLWLLSGGDVLHRHVIVYGFERFGAMAL